MRGGASGGGSNGSTSARPYTGEATRGGASGGGSNGSTSARPPTGEATDKNAENTAQLTSALVELHELRRQCAPHTSLAPVEGSLDDVD